MEAVKYSLKAMVIYLGRKVSRCIHREQNVMKGYYSQNTHSDDRTLDDDTLTFINSKYGPFSINRFVSHKNAKLSRVNANFAQYVL